MGKIRPWVLFVEPVHVLAEDEEEAIALAKTQLQFLLAGDTIVFGEVLDEESNNYIDTRTLNEKEIVEADNKSQQPFVEMEEDDIYDESD